MSKNTILETERLQLVMWHRDDAPLIHRLHSTIDTTRYLSGGEPWSLRKAQERLAKWFEEHERDGTCKYKLLSGENGRFMGRAGFSLYGGERPDFELGYSLAQNEWGKGYATEIAAALRDWFFDQNLASKFIAFTHPENAASQHVLTKIGMRGRTPMIVDALECPSFEYSSDMCG